MICFITYFYCVRFAYDARTRTGRDDEVAFGLDDILIDDEHDMMDDDDDDVFMETTQQLQDQDLYDGIGRYLSGVCLHPDRTGPCTPRNNI